MKFELPRGLRDLEPEEYRMVEFARETFLTASDRFGFRTMEPSPIEMLPTLEAKSGASIANEIYSFKDKGGRDIALRFDLTIGLTRYVTARRDLRLPIKLSSFGSMWRYDEPQMGRYRWFHQWDVEIYDSFNLESDAEVIEFTNKYLEMLGLRDTVIEVSDRQLLEEFIRNKLGINEESMLMEMLRAVDKVPKKGQNVVLEEYSAKGFDERKLKDLLGLSTVQGNIDNVMNDDRIKGLTKAKRLADLMDSLQSRGLKNARINMGIVRGLDYYSGIVFEVYDKSVDVGAIVGGGRYDALTAAFGRSDMGATGAAGGIERILHVLSMRKDTSAKCEEKSVYVAYSTESLRQAAISTTAFLRSQNMHAECDLMGRSLKKQLEEASNKGVTSTIIFGPAEFARQEVKVKDMTTGVENTVKIDELPKKLWTAFSKA